MSHDPEPATAPVSFSDVAAESVDESVAREHEITIADDADHVASPTEPFVEVDEAVGADPAADDGAHSAAGDDAGGDSDAVEAGPTEEAGWAPPSGDEVVNSITAAVRR